MLERGIRASYASVHKERAERVQKTLPHVEADMQFEPPKKFGCTPVPRPTATSWRERPQSCTGEKGPRRSPAW